MFVEGHMDQNLEDRHEDGERSWHGELPEHRHRVSKKAHAIFHEYWNATLS